MAAELAREGQIRLAAEQDARRFFKNDFDPDAYPSGVSSTDVTTSFGTHVLSDLPPLLLPVVTGETPDQHSTSACPFAVV